MMKKVILSILVLAFPFVLCAQSSGLFSKKKIRMNQPVTAYMQGAVPVVDGQVVFTKNIVSPSGNSKKVFTDLLQWANLRYMADVEHGVWTDADYYRNLTNAMVKSADEQTGVIVCQADEELVFTNKVLAKDYCKVNYKLEIKVGKHDIVEPALDHVLFKGDQLVVKRVTFKPNVNFATKLSNDDKIPAA